MINNQVMKFEDMRSMSEIFFQSKMFKDATNAAIALVKIQAGQEIGIAPFAAMSGIFIIQGRPTVGAGVIASRIKASEKYNYKVKRIDDQACEIEFTENGEVVGASTFTIEDAKKAGTQNIGKFPRNMLFARAISNGQKWFAPDVFDGPVYTPEDFDAVVENGTATVVSSAPLEKPVINIDDPKFDAIADGIINKGYSFERVAEKYTLTPEAISTIKTHLDAQTPAEPYNPQPVTQQMIHDQNAKPEPF